MNKIFKPFRVYVDDLKHIKVGLIGHPLSLNDLKSGSNLHDEECERFYISFRLAKIPVKWEIIFSKKHPELPPDIIFGQEDEEFFPDIEQLEGYFNWDCSSKTCLSTLMTSLIKEYAIYQSNRISSLPRLDKQWKDLCETTNYSKRNETYFSKNGPGTYNSVASFLFEFSIDTSDMPPYLIRENLGEDKAVLQISFQPPDMTKITPRLFLSPRLEHVMGGSGSLRLPFYGSLDLKSYVEKIETLLFNTLKGIMERYAKRKEFIAGVLAEFHGAIIEYDSESFEEISLLLHHEGFFFTLLITLGDKFPVSPPVLFLQSVYHLQAKGPLCQTYKEYPYSPRWEPKAIIETIRPFLVNKVSEFRQAAFQFSKQS